MGKKTKSISQKINYILRLYGVFISLDIIIRLSEIYRMKIYFVIKICIYKTKTSCSGEGREHQE